MFGRRIGYTIALAILAEASLGEAEATRGERAQERAAEMPDADWWEIMDTGPFISDTYRGYGPEGDIAALKGIAIKLGSNETHSVLFDTETMRMVAGFEGRVIHAGTPWDRKHGGNSYMPENADAYVFMNETGPGWAVNGDWVDPRETPHGPLPREMTKYRGLYRYGEEIVLSYTVGETSVLEKPTLREGSIVRVFELSPREETLQLLVSEDSPQARESERAPEASHFLRGGEGEAKLERLANGKLVVTIPPSDKSLRFEVAYAKRMTLLPEYEAEDLAALTKGGAGIYPETLETKGQLGIDQSPYTVDTIPLPNDNPWFSNVRFGAFDFFEDGTRAACSTWNGDVWIAEGLDGDLEKVTWKRYASGLFQTLGLKIVDGVIYTQGRDQITRLHDLNGDGEADYYECFNNDVKITEGFHEFSFDLETDSEGNFYFSKGMPVQAGGRGFSPWTEHNGAVLKVSADGSTLERYAWGLRAPGGIGVGPNGEITTGENEGSYVPRCKITWSQPGSFHGVVPSEWDGRNFVRTLPGAPTDYERPLLWLPYNVDNSSGSQIWVPEDSSWGPVHRNEMLHFSYGKSSIFRVLKDEVDGQVQGAVYKLPIDLAIPAQRGKFHPQSGDLYVMGLRGWQTNGGTGFQRVRYVEETTPVPTGLRAYENGFVIDFSGPVDVAQAEDVRRYGIKKWNYIWGPQYGSGRFSIDRRDAELEAEALKTPSKGAVNNVDTVSLRAAKVLNDGKSVFLYVPNMTEAMQMEVKMDIASASGEAFRETLWNTVHNLRKPFRDHGLDLANLPEIDTEPLGIPGLTMTMAYEAADDATMVDRMAFNVPSETTITPFMKTNKTFEALFEGSLVVESRDQIAFRMEGDGKVSFQIDGKTVFEGDLPLESEAFELNPGAHTIYASYQSHRPSPGRLQLLWSGEAFHWEAVPASAFRAVSTDMVERYARTREGRSLFAAARCIECHDASSELSRASTPMPELLESLPDFVNIGDRLNRGWLENWVREPSDFCPTIAPEDAADVAAYLASLTSGESEETLSGNSETGEGLIKDLHLTYWTDELAEEAKHTPAGLTGFLQDPAKHHADTIFPEVRLSDQEASDIAAYIVGKRPKVASASEGDAAKGEGIVANSCLVCHGQGDETYAVPASDFQDMWAVDWASKGCLAEDRGEAPDLNLDAQQRQALIAFHNTTDDALFTWAPREYAARTIERLNCLECHSGENALPDISRVGEKLRTDWLETLFAGEAEKVRPWLKTRMPAFASRAETLAEAFASSHGSTFEHSSSESDEDMIQVGETLAGMTGYACVTCHAVGDQAAVMAFEGQGPNLLVSGKRLRYDFYQSWMHFPQRYVPTTIMPKYTSGKGTALNATHYDGDSEKQFEAIWQWMINGE